MKDNHKYYTQLKLVDYKEYLKNDYEKVDISGSKLNKWADNLYKAITHQEDNNAVVEKAKAYGVEQEPIILEEYKQRFTAIKVFTGLKTIQAIYNFKNEKYHIAISVDGLAIDPITKRAYILEVKAGYKSKKTAAEKFEVYKNQIAFYANVLNYLFSRRQSFIKTEWLQLDTSDELYFAGAMLISKNQEEDLNIAKYGVKELLEVYDTETIPLIESYFKEKKEFVPTKETTLKLSEDNYKQVVEIGNDLFHLKTSLKQLESLIEEKEAIRNELLSLDKLNNDKVIYTLNDKEVITVERTIRNVKEYEKIFKGIKIERSKILNIKIK